MQQNNILINSCYHLTYFETRILICILSSLQKTNQDLSQISIPLDTLAGSHDLSGKTYKSIRDAVGKIVSKKIIIHKTTTGNLPVTCNIIDSCEHKNGQKYISVRISDQIKPYFQDLASRFSSVAINHMLSFRSFYSFRLYLLLMYEQKKETHVEVDHLYWILGLSNKYDDFCAFELRIIKKAQEELKFTDMAFDYRKARYRVPIGKIIFRIKKRPKELIPPTPLLSDEWVKPIEDYFVYTLNSEHPQEKMIPTSNLIHTQQENRSEQDLNLHLNEEEIVEEQKRNEMVKEFITVRLEKYIVDQYRNYASDNNLRKYGPLMERVLQAGIKQLRMQERERKARS